MVFSRRIQPRKRLEGTELTRALAGIGMRFAAKPALDPPIEDTLYFASEEGMERDDLRTLGMLTAWLEVHSPWVHVSRLVRLVQTSDSDRVRTFWAAVGQWLGADRRYVRLESLTGPPRKDLLRVGTAVQIRRHGEDRRFQGTLLRVPGAVFRTRSTDILSPAELARRHRGYRARVMQGPSYRADMWACLEQNPSLTASELARQTYGSFDTARLTKRDFALVHGDTVP